MMILKSPWLLAATITTIVAVGKAATVLHIIPGTTIVDVGALLVTGFLVDLFAGFHIMQRRIGKSDGSERG